MDRAAPPSVALWMMTASRNTAFSAAAKALCDRQANASESGGPVKRSWTFATPPRKSNPAPSESVRDDAVVSAPSTRGEDVCLQKEETNNDHLQVSESMEQMKGGEEQRLRKARRWACAVCSRNGPFTMTFDEADACEKRHAAEEETQGAAALIRSREHCAAIEAHRTAEEAHGAATHGGASKSVATDQPAVDITARSTVTARSTTAETFTTVQRAPHVDGIDSADPGPALANDSSTRASLFVGEDEPNNVAGQPIDSGETCPPRNIARTSLFVGKDESNNVAGQPVYSGDTCPPRHIATTLIAPTTLSTASGSAAASWAGSASSSPAASVQRPHKRTRCAEVSSGASRACGDADATRTAVLLASCKRFFASCEENAKF